ncbi:ABC transporter substrate-binding protein [Nitratireductor aquimarinus]|uniref:ABC transporter substrate-binding protein n=1 Tax=Nitratireductor aquimarinus TaxID=889300 RepID=UPI001A8D0B61|nr:ABC transporter substrate-binding protein [Nitratireductor aquimarinus]MBN8243101.1 ABC transporter substrate-binding protein [Nitratireductor aquimarinus]MBY6131002.1 ABC transporter substrate-binding protein [Nitratireductor aquimarinus]MCA1302242.1 ABC transporter substrate-binding protein [Nitratireductor aquimarinus]
MKRLLATTAIAALFAAPAFAVELTVGAANVAPYLDPGRDHSNVGSQFYHNAFDTLIAKTVVDGETVWKPALATEWTLIEPTVMELKLREGVKFHNGEDMTADDVVFSLNRMYQATFPPYQVRSRDRLSNFAKAEKIDDHTIRIHAKREEPLWETLLNLQQVMIIPENYTKGLTGDPAVAENDDFEAFSLKPVGTGPYRIATFSPGEELVYERFADFWGDSAPLDRVTVKRMPETASRMTALKTGEADIITNVAPDQLALIESDPALKTVGAPTALFHVMIMNMNHPRLEDPRIRQAMSLAIDRDMLNEALWLGKAVVPSSHTMEEFGPLYMPELKTFEYDPEKAKALLEEAGYDGFEITFDTAPTYYTNGLLAAQAIMEMWAEVGINGKVQVGDKWTGNAPEMMARNWSNPMYFSDPFGSFGVMWAPNGPSESEGRFNTDEDYAEIWERFRFSDDVETRKAAYAELMDRIKANPPVLPLYRPYESWAMRQDVNWAPQPGNIPYVLDFRAGAIDFASN